MAGEQRSDPIEQAEDWLDEQTTPEGNRPKGLEDAHATPTVEELRREQRREATGATLAHTEGHLRGAPIGAIVFGAIGLVVGLFVGFLFFDGDSPARFVMPAVITAFGAWIGVVYWGGRTPELENETMSATGEPQDGTTPRDPGTDDRGR
jgi:hypothetical protein